MLRVHLPLRPVPQRDSAVSRRGYAYITTKDRNKIAEFNSCIREAVSGVEGVVGGKLIVPDGCGVAVFYELVFKVPESANKRDRAACLGGQKLRLSTPDRVNCEDFLDNRLKDTIIEDDRLIVFGASVKRYGKEDATIIYVRAISDYSDVVRFVWFISTNVLGKNYEKACSFNAGMFGLHSAPRV